MMILQFAVLVLSVVAIAGHFTVDGFSDLKERAQLDMLAFADLLFVNSVSLQANFSSAFPFSSSEFARLSRTQLETQQIDHYSPYYN